jgi:hypothetical protein
VEYRFQHPQRLSLWESAHPEYEGLLLAWTNQFLSNPFDSRLSKRPYIGIDGQPVPNTFHYLIPGVPIPLVIAVENAERNRRPYDPDDPYPVEDDFDDGIRMARILSPMSPDDIAPEDKME